MKHLSSSSTATRPLTGSIGKLLTIGLIAWISVAPVRDTFAESRARTPAALTASEKKDVQKAPARSPEEALKAGLEYLLQHQQSGGGWGQGGGWRQNAAKGRVEGANVEDPADLGNTCVSLMALLRAGHAPDSGEHREAARKAFEYLCVQVEQADETSLFVSATRDTQLQVKIGTYVDTFLAGWALSELKGRTGDEAAESRRATALNKVVAKIERNQKEDGSFEGNKGWAAVISQGLCSKALNSASRSGAKVSQNALEKDQRQNLAGLDVAKGDFSAAPATAAEPSSAGISLYRESSKLGGLREKAKSNAPRKAEAQKRIADADVSEAEKAQARSDLQTFENDEKAAQVAQSAIAGKLGDSRYVAGFGNHGGEEFLSYLNLGESMREQGGKPWEDWKTKMHATLCAAQNDDGSWAGHHCITGRNFCTSAALLTLLVERMPTQISAVESAKPALSAVNRE
jgi:hypothetical protein